MIVDTAAPPTGEVHCWWRAKRNTFSGVDTWPVICVIAQVYRSRATTAGRCNSVIWQYLLYVTLSTHESIILLIISLKTTERQGGDALKTNVVNETA